MSVGAVCSALTVTAEMGEGLTMAASRMRYNDVGAVPVVRDGTLIGILTERDLTRALADGVDGRTALVEDYMTPDPQFVGPDTELRQAARLMYASGMRHLPVVDNDGTLVGMISMRDLLVELL